MFSVPKSTFGQGTQPSQASGFLSKIRCWTRLSHASIELLKCCGSYTLLGDGQIWEEEGTEAPLRVKSRNFNSYHINLLKIQIHVASRI